MSKAKKQYYTLDRDFNQRDQVGCVEIIKNTRTGLSDELMARMVIAPAVEQQADGSLKIIGWSLIPASRVKGGNSHGPKSSK